MMTTKEIAAMRDKLAIEMPQANEYRFPTLNDLFAFVGMEPSASFTEQVAASVKAEAKIRYMYADAMMEARKPAKNEPFVDNEGWVEHNGEFMPCKGGLRVKVKYEDGTTEESEAECFYWGLRPLPNDIVAWRPAK